jgi:succinyl-CoA synthetase beta subunit
VDLYEYQGKQLFARFGIPVSEGLLASTPAEAREAAERLSGPVVVKAQVLTGGRGKAGGIKLADTAADAQARAAEILGMDIRGHRVRHVWIEQASDIAAEWYFSITFDRAAKRSLFMLTTEGGIDIEQVAAERPERIARLHVDPLVGSQPYQASNLIFRAGIPAQHRRGLALIIERAYRAYTETDAVLVEINPLIVTTAGELRALDAKYSVDDNALFRHPDIAAMRDVEAADPQEQLARERGVTYVKLDGDVGILGNGAGLVMSTLDVVAAAGGRPANFLDAGGGSKAEAITSAVEVILSDEKVSAVLFNIFGGITRCDEVARGLIEAFAQIKPSVPFVVRLDGTNDVEARELLAEAALPNVHTEATMLGAARKVVDLAGEAGRSPAGQERPEAEQGDQNAGLEAPRS